MYADVTFFRTRCNLLPDYVLFSADKVWYKIGTQGCFLRI